MDQQKIENLRTSSNARNNSTGSSQAQKRPLADLKDSAIMAQSSEVPLHVDSKQFKLTSEMAYYKHICRTVGLGPSLRKQQNPRGSKNNKELSFVNNFYKKYAQSQQKNVDEQVNPDPAQQAHRFSQRS